MDATGATFNRVGGDYSNTLIQVNSGGELTAAGSTFALNQLVLEDGSLLTSTDLTGDTFNLPVYVPALDIPLLADNLELPGDRDLRRHPHQRAVALPEPDGHGIDGQPGLRLHRRLHGGRGRR